MFGSERLQIIDLLKEGFARRGTKKFVTDVDDTILDMSLVYRTKMKEFAAVISGFANTDQEEVFSLLVDALNGLRRDYNVHPTIMQEAARVVALKYGLRYYADERVVVATDRLMTIYEAAPPVFDGVHEALQAIKATGIEVFAVSNADPSWTRNIKLPQNGLCDIFGDNVYCIPPYEFKDVQGWLRAFDCLGISPNEALCVEDNWRSGIAPLRQIGVPDRNLIRVKTDYDYANHGKIDGIEEVEMFKDIVGTIIKV